MKTIEQIKKIAKKEGCKIVDQDNGMFSVVSKYSNSAELFSHVELEKYFCLKV